MYYLLKDYLGSTTDVVNPDGTLSRMRYTAWGDVLSTTGTLPTDKQFTGQAKSSNSGLYFYQSRWYDPYLGRFVQPDSIIPSLGEGGNLNSVGYSENENYSALVVNYSENQLLGQLNGENRKRLQNPNTIFPSVPINPLAYDHYAYCLNNPIGYDDPSGHFAEVGALALFAVSIPGVDCIIIGAVVIITVIVVIVAIDNRSNEVSDANSTVAFSGNTGGAAQAAQHLSMLLGGSLVAGFGSHPGMPDPDGRDRKHNVEGLRNSLKSIQQNLRNGETIDQFLSRQGWEEDQIKDFITRTQDYIKYVLPNDVANYGVSQDLSDEIIDLASKMGIH